MIKYSSRFRRSKPKIRLYSFQPLKGFALSVLATFPYH